MTRRGRMWVTSCLACLSIWTGLVRTVPNDFEDSEEFQSLLLNWTSQYFSYSHSHRGQVFANISSDDLNNSDVNIVNLMELGISDNSVLAAARRRDRQLERRLAQTWEPLTASEEHIRLMLTNVLSFPRSHLHNVTTKSGVRDYIKQKFESYKLMTGSQHFMPDQYHLWFQDDPPLGTNIIGILAGKKWGSREDRITVVGAHYDTVTFSPGFNDNGSGVSVLIDVARALTSAACRPEYSIIFVAFDLEEVGSQGSRMFIKEYLIPYIMRPFNWPHFQGAYVLDTLMNFNRTLGAQQLPPDWKIMLPKLHEELESEGYIGDFMGIVYRREVDYHIANTFYRQWELLGQQQYRVKKLDIALPAEMPSIETLAQNLNFLRSDHARFWYMNDEDVPFTLNSVLITDTGPYRGIHVQCYHNTCDTAETNLDPEGHNLRFLTKAAQAIINSVLELSVAICGGPGPDGGDVTSGAAGANSSMLLGNTLTILKWLGVV